VGGDDVIPTRLIAWATPRPKSCSRPDPWPSCTFKPKPIKRPNNKGHAKKRSNWASFKMA